MVYSLPNIKDNGDPLFQKHLGTCPAFLLQLIFDCHLQIKQWEVDSTKQLKVLGVS